MIGSAFAQASGASPFGGGLDFLIPMILIFVVFYFLLIRPQQKKVKQHKDMLGAIRRGDRVVTGGGIIGTVTKVVSDGEVAVEIAEGVRVRVQRGMIASVLAKTEPVKEEAKPEAQAKAEPEAKGGAQSPPDAKPAVAAVKGGAASIFKTLIGGRK